MVGRQATSTIYFFPSTCVQLKRSFFSGAQRQDRWVGNAVKPKGLHAGIFFCMGTGAVCAEMHKSP